MCSETSLLLRFPWPYDSLHSEREREKEIKKHSKCQTGILLTTVPYSWSSQSRGAQKINTSQLSNLEDFL